MKSFITLFIVLFSLNANSITVSSTADDFQQQARSLSDGHQLELTEVKLGTMGEVALTLERVRVFAPDATITIHTDQGVVTKPMPDNVYLAGKIKGQEHSRVLVGFLENGQIEGMVDTGAEDKYALRWQQANQFKLIRENQQDVTMKDDRWFNPKDYLEVPKDQMNIPEPVTRGGAGSTHYELTVAVETDFEMYSIFGNSTDVTNYITGLIAYVSYMYFEELYTYVLLGHLSLWSTAADPWAETSTTCALFEVGKYWNDNNGAIDRAVTHFISGKSLGGGVAWRGVLCNGEFDYDTTPSSCTFTGTDNYGGAYGVSAGLGGSFNPNAPTSVWDMVVVAHELGHNFDSPHTHCYAGLGGNASPVDECYNGEGGCFGGTETLPGPLGAGSGTIMSYCHLLSGGLSNIALNLGTRHPYGVEPVRVPNLMRDHVESRAGSFPACIRPTTIDLIYYSGLES